MKIIELFNKIANGGEVPKQIKYRDWLYDWNENAKDYECSGDWLEERICDDFKTFLNDEVEVIEDNKKIEKPLCCHMQQGIKLNKEDLSRIAIQNKENIKNIYDKLVEIIEVLNERQNNNNNGINSNS